MKTSNFANNARYKLNGISISRYPDRRSGFKGPEFTPLMPSAQLLAWYKESGDWEVYSAHYNDQLRLLDAQKVYNYLGALSLVPEPILLCYESAKTLDAQPCHRCLVASWFERELGIVVPEWVKP
jgi:hypothetical protein